MSCYRGQSLTASELYNKSASAAVASAAVTPVVAPAAVAPAAVAAPEVLPAAAASSLRGSGSKGLSGSGRTLTGAEQNELNTLQRKLDSGATLTPEEMARYNKIKDDQKSMCSIL
jgi:hypothetical protein